MNKLKENLLKRIINPIKDNIKSNPQSVDDIKIKIYMIFFTSLVFGIFIGIEIKGSSDLSLIIKVLTPVFIALALTKLPSYVDTQLEGYNKEIQKVHEEETEKIKKDHDIEKNDWKMGLNDPYRQNQDLEFLSIVFYESNQSFPRRLYLGKFCTLVNELQKETNSLEEAAKNYAYEFDIRQKALEGLAKGFTPEENKKVSRFAELIVESCNYALDNTTKPLDIRINYKWAMPFYKNIRIYLKAWLVCSIRHGVAIGIMPLFQEPLEDEGKDRYHGIETCIVAIKHIQLLFDHKKMTEILDSQESRDIVKLYLEELIKMLESNNTSEINTRGWGHLMTSFVRL